MTTLTNTFPCNGFAPAGVFATGTVPDGFNGHRARVSWHWDWRSGKTICSHAHGSFTYNTPRAASEAEALWLLKHHPSARGARITWQRVL